MLKTVTKAAGCGLSGGHDICAPSASLKHVTSSSWFNARRAHTLILHAILTVKNLSYGHFR